MGKKEFHDLMLGIECEGLPNGKHSKNLDAFAAVFFREFKDFETGELEEKWTELGRTEVHYNVPVNVELQPGTRPADETEGLVVFKTMVKMDYLKEKHQPVRVRVFDKSKMSAKDNLREHDLLGQIEFTLKSIVEDTPFASGCLDLQVVGKAAKSSGKHDESHDHAKVRVLASIDHKAFDAHFGEYAKKPKSMGGKVYKQTRRVAQRSLSLLFGADKKGAYLRRSHGRECRDVPCCCLFVTYWAVMLYMVWTSVEDGDIDSLTMPPSLYNAKGVTVSKALTAETFAPGSTTTPLYSGKICGKVGSALEGFPVAYWPLFTDQHSYMCLSKCPGKLPAAVYATGIPPYKDADFYKYWQCSPEVIKAGKPKTLLSYCTTYESGNLAACALGASWISGKGLCYPPYGDTMNLLRRCIPVDEAVVSNGSALMQTQQGQMASQYFIQIKDYYWSYYTALGVSLVISFIWIIFLDYFAAPLIWATVFIITISMPIIGTLALVKSGNLEMPTFKNGNGTQVEVPSQVTDGLQSLDVSKDQALNVAYGAYSFFVVFTVFFQFFKKRIIIAIGVIEEASDAFLTMPGAIAFPLGQFVISLPFMAYGLYTTATILSLRRMCGTASGPLVCNDEAGPARLTDLWNGMNIKLATGKNNECVGCAKTVGPGGYLYTEFVQTMLAFNLFGVLWTINWINAVQYTAISGGVADWYYTPEDKNGTRKLVTRFPIASSLYRVLRFNPGTMAFGGFIITMVAVIKMVLVYMIKQVMAQSPENAVVKLMGHLLMCVVHCVEKFIQFIGHLAYIEVAIYGKNFCSAVIRASKRLLKNMVRFTFVTFFAKLLILMGKAGIIIGTCMSIMWYATVRDCLIEAAEASAESAKAGATCADKAACEAAAIASANVAAAAADCQAATLTVPYAPLVLCGLIAGVISYAVMGVYETAIDTIMMCFLEDEAENVGDKPNFASGPLMQFMSGTKLIADTEEKFRQELVDARTKKIQGMNKSEEDMLIAAKAMGEQAEKHHKGKKKSKQRKGKAAASEDSADV